MKETPSTFGNRVSGRVYVAACGAAVAIHVGLCHLLTSEMALDMDTVNLIYAVRDFDMTKLAPHPPGYLPYVLLLKGIHALTGFAPLVVVQLTAGLFSIGTILVVPAIGKQLGADIATRVSLLFLAAFHPFLVYYSVDGQTHASEGFAAALLFYRLFRDGTRFRDAVVWGCIIAFGVALRPSFLLIAAGPVLIHCWTRKRLLWIVGGIIALMTLSWLIPTMSLSGGFARWQMAHRAFIIKTFVTSGPPMRHTAFALLVWGGLLAAPALPGIRRVGKLPAELNRFVLAAVLPPLVFFLVTFAAEPGYLQGMVPLALLVTGILVSHAPRPLWAGTAALVIEIGILLLPAGGSIGMTLPSAGEIIQREVASEAMLNAVFGPLDPSQHVLFLTDYSGTPFQRQLPLLRAHTHVLWLYHGPGNSIASMSFATEKTMFPIPGPVMLAKGPPMRFDTASAYHVVVLDPLLGNSVRHLLVAQSACPIPPRTPRGQMVHLLATCFPKGRLAFGGHTVVFKTLPLDGAQTHANSR